MWGWSAARDLTASSVLAEPIPSPGTLWGDVNVNMRHLRSTSEGEPRPTPASPPKGPAKPPKLGPPSKSGSGAPSPASSSPPLWLVHASLVFVQVSHGGYQVLSKHALAIGTSQIVFCAYRDILACIILCLCAYFHDRGRRPVFSHKLALMFFFLGLTGVYGNQLLFMVGLDLTSPPYAAALQPSIPVFTLMLAVLFRLETIIFRRRDGLAKIAGVLLCITGATVLAGYRGPVAFSSRRGGVPTTYAGIHPYPSLKPVGVGVGAKGLGVGGGLVTDASGLLVPMKLLEEPDTVLGEEIGDMVATDGGRGVAFADSGEEVLAVLGGNGGDVIQMGGGGVLAEGDAQADPHILGGPMSSLKHLSGEEGSMDGWAGVEFGHEGGHNRPHSLGLDHHQALALEHTPGGVRLLDPGAAASISSSSGGAGLGDGSGESHVVSAHMHVGGHADGEEPQQPHGQEYHVATHGAAHRSAPIHGLHHYVTTAAHAFFGGGGGKGAPGRLATGGESGRVNDPIHPHNTHNLDEPNSSNDPRVAVDAAIADIEEFLEAQKVLHGEDEGTGGGSSEHTITHQQMTRLKQNLFSGTREGGAEAGAQGMGDMGLSSERAGVAAHVGGGSSSHVVQHGSHPAGGAHHGVVVGSSPTGVGESLLAAGNAALAHPHGDGSRSVIIGGSGHSDTGHGQSGTTGGSGSAGEDDEDDDIIGSGDDDSGTASDLSGGQEVLRVPAGMTAASRSFWGVREPLPRATLASLLSAASSRSSEALDRSRHVSGPQARPILAVAGHGGPSGAATAGAAASSGVGGSDSDASVAGRLMEAGAGTPGRHADMDTSTADSLRGDSGDGLAGAPGAVQLASAATAAAPSFPTWDQRVHGSDVQMIVASSPSVVSAVGGPGRRGIVKVTVPRNRKMRIGQDRIVMGMMDAASSVEMGTSVAKARVGGKSRKGEERSLARAAARATAPKAEVKGGGKDSGGKEGGGGENKQPPRGSKNKQGKAASAASIARTILEVGAARQSNRGQRVLMGGADGRGDDGATGDAQRGRGGEGERDQGRGATHAGEDEPLEKGQQDQGQLGQGQQEQDSLELSEQEHGQEERSERDHGQQDGEGEAEDEHQGERGDGEEVGESRDAALVGQGGDEKVEWGQEEYREQFVPGIVLARHTHSEFKAREEVLLSPVQDSTLISSEMDPLILVPWNGEERGEEEQEGGEEEGAEGEEENREEVESVGEEGVKEDQEGGGEDDEAIRCAPSTTQSASDISVHPENISAHPSGVDEADGGQSPPSDADPLPEGEWRRHLLASVGGSTTTTNNNLIRAASVAGGGVGGGSGHIRVAGKPVRVVIEEDDKTSSAQIALGVTCLMGNCMCLALYLTIQSFALRLYPVPTTTTAVAYCCGGLCILLTAATNTRAADWAISGTAVVAILYAGLVASALNFSILAWANKQVGPATVSMYLPVQPFAATLLSYVFLGTPVYTGR
eukprot:jgi/Mesvir1/7663/Mv11423-RA.1